MFACTQLVESDAAEIELIMQISPSSLSIIIFLLVSVQDHYQLPVAPLF